MSLDPATEYLIRKDKKALQKRLQKNERTLSVIQAKWHEQVGLLAATQRRLLFVYKPGLRYKHVEIPRSEMQKIHEQKGRPSIIHIVTKKGSQHRFVMVQHGAAEVFIDKVVPPTMIRTGASQQARKDGPMEFKPSRRPAPTAKPTPPANAAAARANHDPLTASKVDKLARLERLHKLGRLTEGEYRWQRDALER